MTETLNAGTPGQHIFTKTLRDGMSQLAIYIEPDGDRPLALSWRLAVYKDGDLITRCKNRPRRMDKPAAPGLTHGLAVRPDVAVGLTASEAATIDAGVEAWISGRKHKADTERAELAERLRAAAPDAAVFTISGPDSPCGAGETVRLADGRAVTGLSVRGRYISEDGWSLGVMDESGWLYTTEVREATPAETAGLEAAESVTAHRDSLRAQGMELTRLDAERAPEAETSGVLALPGVRIEPERHTMAFGAEAAHQHLRADRENGVLWVLTYNGADGDNWSYSNCGTYIARRMPLTPETDALLAELAREFGTIPA